MNAEYICPVVTAFCGDGTIDTEAMIKIYKRLIENGIDGIAILGSAGEFYSMTFEEASSFAMESLKYLKGKIPIYVGTGRLVPEETIRLSNQMLENGANAVMIISPYYIGAQSEGVEEYYDKVLGEIKGSVILYNYPERTGHDLTPDMVLNLRKRHQNIVGYKDTTEAVSHTRELIFKVKKEYPDFKVYSGYDENFAHTVLSGGDGCIAALSNLVPEICSGWVKAFRNNNLEEVKDMQRIIDKFMALYSISTPFMPAMKYALKKVGVQINSVCKLPAIELNQRQKELLNKLLTEEKLI